MEKKFDPRDYRDNPTAIAQYLTEILEKNDIVELVRAIGNVLRAQNVRALSPEAGLRRQSLYRMCRGDIDPRLGNRMKVLNSLGVQLVVSPRKRVKDKPE